MVSKKTDLVVRLISKIDSKSPAPQPLEGANLLEQGLYAVLLRRLDAKQAEKVLESLRKAYVDWNELRVAQAQEIAQHFRVGNLAKPVAEDIRSYLQEVFQRSHGLDLEFLRTDPEAAKRFASILPFIGMATAHYLMWLAAEGELPVTTALMRVLDRAGIAARVSNVKKARAALAPLAPKGRELDFVMAMGEVASRWCLPQSPLCHQCAIVDDCKYGKKAFREWKMAQERMEVQRQREEARTAILRKKEDARRAREDARRVKQEAADQRAREREAARKSRVMAARKAAEDKRQAGLRARDEAKRKREDERLRKAAEVEAKRKAAADKKAQELAAAKKAAEKAAAKEAARKKAEAAKLAARKAAEKVAAKKKAAAAKKSARKPSPRRSRKS
jgi:endonuclease III